MNTPKCSVCDWSNTGLLNLGEPNGNPVWMCHGCIKQERTSLKSALESMTKERDEFVRTEPFKKQECVFYRVFFLDVFKLIPQSEDKTTGECMAEVIGCIKIYQQQLESTRRENEKMREALQRIATQFPCDDSSNPDVLARHKCEQARQALSTPTVNADKKTEL